MRVRIRLITDVLWQFSLCDLTLCTRSHIAGRGEGVTLQWIANSCNLITRDCNDLTPGPYSSEEGGKVCFLNQHIKKQKQEAESSDAIRGGFRVQSCVFQRRVQGPEMWSEAVQGPELWLEAGPGSKTEIRDESLVQNCDQRRAQGPETWSGAGSGSRNVIRSRSEI
jgi:hypothetical protein